MNEGWVDVLLHFNSKGEKGGDILSAISKMGDSPPKATQKLSQRLSSTTPNLGIILLKSDGSIEKRDSGGLRCVEWWERGVVFIANHRSN